jgi:hypothetical protein
MRIFFFGVWAPNRVGHYLYDANGRDCEPRLPDDFPMRPMRLDTGLLPFKGEQVEGLATHLYLNGWSIITFWDRSGDSRPGSNSAFVIDGLHSFADCCTIAREKFPSIWARFKFEVVTAPGRCVDR